MKQNGCCSPRAFFFYAWLCASVVLIASIVVEHCCHLSPCPLCLLQRVVYGVLALLTLLAAMHNPQALGRRLYAFFILLLCSLGIGLAARQLWLQVMPHDPNAACLPGLHFMLKTMPVEKVLSLTWQGSAECAQVDWSFFHLSMAAWSLIFFGGIACLMIIQLFRARKNGHAA